MPLTLDLTRKTSPLPASISQRTPPEATPTYKLPTDLHRRSQHDASALTDPRSAHDQV
ncbi:uncharacterized protein B0H18DRAFT_1001709 [Fomitopsis serialis]|uniref:uncharacterized protein n=1 Tax=Fomitopsis serialis TaxID=139415 RepID=UPI0020083FE3|nr:uncharacterized protein B0H18DRAFT_1001709 [Neoantrodia serialis]KAH9928184.1 hypothetical protein B0H18DRAFT_1001709 [Neoantrodia serialis]